MCILFFYFTSSPTEPYKLILASNRDEFYNRLAEPAAFWKEDNHIYGGMDMEPGREGGTWLGISQKGKLGALLNVMHRPGKNNTEGRGSLVVNFLKSDSNAQQYLDELHENSKKFGFFHLILFELVDQLMEVYHLSNAEPYDRNEKLSAGFHSYSNCFKHKVFRKLVKGNSIFEGIIKNIGNNFDSILTEDNKEQLTSHLLDFLSDEECNFPDEQILEQGAGFNEEDLRKLSSIFVRNNCQNYGTRTQTVVLIDRNDEVHYTENTAVSPIDPENLTWSRKTEVFKIYK